jgi:hypothetical protein
MKLAEFGLDKAGIRDSMATREANAAGGAALNAMANPMQSAAAPNPSNPLAGVMSQGANAQMSPVVPTPQAPTPDMFDKAMGLMDGFGGRSGPKSPFEFILERTNVIQPRDQQQPTDAAGLMKMLEEQNRRKSPFEVIAQQFGGK